MQLEKINWKMIIKSFSRLELKTKALFIKYVARKTKMLQAESNGSEGTPQPLLQTFCSLLLKMLHGRFIADAGSFIIKYEEYEIEVRLRSCHLFLLIFFFLKKGQYLSNAFEQNSSSFEL